MNPHLSTAAADVTAVERPHAAVAIAPVLPLRRPGATGSGVVAIYSLSNRHRGGRANPSGNGEAVSYPNERGNR